MQIQHLHGGVTQRRGGGVRENQPEQRKSLVSAGAGFKLTDQQVNKLSAQHLRDKMAAASPQTGGGNDVTGDFKAPATELNVANPQVQCKQYVL